MINIDGDWTYEREMEGCYTVIAEGERVGTMISETAAWLLCKVPEMYYLLKELVYPEETPDVDTYRYAQKLVERVKERSKKE